MSRMPVAFEFESTHGCVVVRDTESDGDISDWDGIRPWFLDRGSAIFAIRPGVEGSVRCEVWVGTPNTLLAHTLFVDEVDFRGALQIEDPGGLFNSHIRLGSGAHQLAVLVDKEIFAANVQIVVDGDF